jgi:hypothetical protein
MMRLQKARNEEKEKKERIMQHSKCLLNKPNRKDLKSIQ